MNAIGTDIWGTADQFRFAYKTLTGNGTIVARVDSLYNSNVWAKAGVMIRQNTDAGSVHAFMASRRQSPGNGASFQRRLAAAAPRRTTTAPRRRGGALLGEDRARGRQLLRPTFPRMASPGRNWATPRRSR